MHKLLWRELQKHAKSASSDIILFYMLSHVVCFAITINQINLFVSLSFKPSIHLIMLDFEGNFVIDLFVYDIKIVTVFTVLI